MLPMSSRFCWAAALTARTHKLIAATRRRLENVSVDETRKVPLSSRSTSST